MRASINLSRNKKEKMNNRISLFLIIFFEKKFFEKKEKGQDKNFE